MPFTLRSVARSHVGLVRRDNQDSGYAGDHLLVVADGMGGHAGGDVASSIAVAALVGLDSEAPGADALQQLARAITGAQDTIMGSVREDPSLKGMGTTVTAVLRSGDRLVLAHIGDSRAYLLRAGELTQVTSDHTFVQMLVDEGRITAEEAQTHPQRSVIMRVLGDVDAEVELDTSARSAVDGDRWLLCSDGLSGPVSDETIGETLRGHADLDECARALVDLALKGGGPDNVTCVLADVVDERSADGSAATAVVGAAALHRPRTGDEASSPASRAAVLVHEADTQPVPTPGTAGAPGPHAPHGRTEQPDRSDRSDRSDGQEASLRPRDGRRSQNRSHRRSRGRGARWVLALVVTVVLLAGGALAVRAWLDRQYFVGAEAGDVVIYRGLAQDVGPLSLSRVVQRSSMAITELPPIYRQRVQETIAADDLPDARRILTGLDDARSSAAEPAASGASADSATGADEGAGG